VGTGRPVTRLSTTGWHTTTGTTRPSCSVRPRITLLSSDDDHPTAEYNTETHRMANCFVDPLP